jgi:hypothetical protein
MAGHRNERLVQLWRTVGTSPTPALMHSFQPYPGYSGPVPIECIGYALQPGAGSPMIFFLSTGTGIGGGPHARVMFLQWVP